MKLKRRSDAKRRETDTRRRRKNIEKGRCPKHTSRLADVGIYCVECWLSSTAYKATGSCTNKNALANLWRAQDGRCAKTDVVLLPGINASIDHIIPVSRYEEIHGNMAGVNDISNLQWVIKKYNTAKNNMLEDEFELFIEFNYNVILKRRKIWDDR